MANKILYHAARDVARYGADDLDIRMHFQSEEDPNGRFGLGWFSKTVMVPKVSFSAEGVTLRQGIQPDQLDHIGQQVPHDVIVSESYTSTTNVYEHDGRWFNRNFPKIYQVIQRAFGNIMSTNIGKNIVSSSLSTTYVREYSKGKPYLLMHIGSSMDLGLASTRKANALNVLGYAGNIDDGHIFLNLPRFFDHETRPIFYFGEDGNFHRLPLESVMIEEFAQNAGQIGDARWWKEYKKRNLSIVDESDLSAAQAEFFDMLKSTIIPDMGSIDTPQKYIAQMNTDVPVQIVSDFLEEMGLPRKATYALFTPEQAQALVNYAEGKNTTVTALLKSVGGLQKYPSPKIKRNPRLLSGAYTNPLAADDGEMVIREDITVFSSLPDHSTTVEEIMNRDLEKFQYQAFMSEYGTYGSAGGSLGTTIAGILWDQYGNDNVALGIAVSAIGNTLGTYAVYTAAAVFDSRFSLDNRVFSSGEIIDSLSGNLYNAAIGYAAGFLTNKLLGRINFGDGLLGELAEVSSTAAVNYAISYGIQNTIAYFAEGAQFSSFNPLSAVAGAVGSWAGQKLATAIYSGGNPQGRQIGASIGSTIGQIAAKFLPPPFNADGPLGPITTFVFSFHGAFYGSLIGSLFGGSPGKPRAISYVVWTGEDFVAFGTYEENGGSGRIAASMADAAAKAMRSLLTLTGGTLDRIQSNVRIGFGHENDYYVNTYLPNDWDRHYESSQVNVEIGVVRQMRRYRIIGGDPYVKRALMRDKNYRLEPLYKSMAVAVEYSTYMDNPALYEQEIERIRGEDPDLAAGHTAMLARAAELKLDTPLWYEFRANPVDDSVTAWDGVSDLTLEDAGEATRVEDDHAGYWYDAKTGGGADVVTLPAGLTIKDLIFRVDGTDLLVLRRGAGADLAARAASATLRLSRWFDPEFRIETLRFADGSELYLPAVINGSADLLAGELFDGAWFDADRTGRAFEALPGPVAADSLVVVDLDGDGIAWLEGSEVRFDIDGDGYAERVDWIGPSDGLLVIDRDGNGRIDDGSELLSAMFAPSQAGTGLTALHSLNDNGDGVLDARDAAWQDLRIWRDNNQNGIVDLGELQALFRYDIDALSLAVLAAPGRHDAGHDPRIQAQTAALQVGRSAATGLALYDVRLDYDADGVRQETWRGAGGATWTLFTFEAKDNIAVLAGDGAITEQVDAATAGIFTAGRGDDVLTVAPGSAGVKINAGAGDDTVVGGAGDDWLVGGQGRDALSGGAGDDTLVVDDADALAEIDAGDGRDTVIFEGSNAVILDLSTIGAEVAVGGRGNDHLWNDNPAAVTAKAPAGDARDGWHPALELAGGAGDDTLIGTAGVDRLDGGADSLGGGGVNRLYVNG